MIKCGCKFHTCKKQYKTKLDLKRHLAGVKMAKTKSGKSSNKTTTSKKAGKKAHKETIGPSHKKCQKFLEEGNSNTLVTPPTGRPDFIVHKKNLSYFELKPVKGAQDRTFLSEDQESEVKKLQFLM